MKRTSRHLVVLLVALGSCLLGMSIAVVAFGQAGNPDAGVPAGDFTGTTPAGRGQPLPADTVPLGAYTATTPAPPATTPKTTEEAAPTQGTATTRSPSRTKKTTRAPVTAAPAPVAPAPPVPSKVVRTGPTHLAFTGGEPIWLGAAGIALMLGGVGVRRRQQGPGSLAG